MADRIKLWDGGRPTRDSDCKSGHGAVQGERLRICRRRVGPPAGGTERIVSRHFPYKRDMLVGDQHVAEPRPPTPNSWTPTRRRRPGRLETVAKLLENTNETAGDDAAESSL